MLAAVVAAGVRLAGATYIYPPEQLTATSATGNLSVVVVEHPSSDDSAAVWAAVLASCGAATLAVVPVGILGCPALRTAEQAATSLASAVPIVAGCVGTESRAVKVRARFVPSFGLCPLYVRLLGAYDTVYGCMCTVRAMV